MRRWKWAAVCVAVLGVAGAAVVAARWHVFKHYEAPGSGESDVFADDWWTRRREDPPPFDPAIVHPVRVGEHGAWLVNRSAARFLLDVPLIFPDTDEHLLQLHPSYAAAIAANHRDGEVLPSVNLIDGKAKQFDDGLCAALDLVCHRGVAPSLGGMVPLVHRLRAAVSDASPAAAYLDAGLEIAHEAVGSSDAGAREAWILAFRKDELRSKPVGYATWSPALVEAFEFRRFFDKELSRDDPIVRDLAAAVARDERVRADYGRLLTVAAGLHGRPACAPIADGAPGTAGASPVALFPRRTSPPLELLRRLFPGGPPAGSDLMVELARRVMSGEVDLAPTAGAGWLDHQVFALETLLVPGRGDEHAKMLLSSRYKQRMLQAFEAVLTKIYDTHDPYATLKGPSLHNEPPPPPKDVRPTMRVEPAPTYYLRTARAYAFLLEFLRATPGETALAHIHGRREGGERDRELLDELRWMRDLFFGLHLVSCDDLGMRPFLANGEAADEGSCRATAIEWLACAFDDRDLAADTRVAFAVQADERATRLWGTIGVRMARLIVSWVDEKDVRIRPAEGEGDWRFGEWGESSAARYLIPVDEFAEIQLGPGRSLSRDELRAACDRHETRAEILAALRE